jgi:hypothetical protein
MARDQIPPITVGLRGYPLYQPPCKKPNEARDYGVPLRGNCDTDNFKLCTPPKGLFHPDDLLDYETIRENQAAVMMAGAKAKTAMYS